MSAAERLIVVAQIAGAFGVRGEVRVRSFTADPEACFDYGPLLDADGRALVTPVRWRPIPEGYGVEPRERRQREEWEAMRGTLLHVPRAALPPPEEDEVYVEDLVGCEVAHADGRALGRVRSVQNFGADDLLEVEHPDRPGIWLLPFTRNCVPEIDLAKRRLIASPPEELLPEPLQRQASEGGTN